MYLKGHGKMLAKARFWASSCALVLGVLCNSGGDGGFRLCFLPTPVDSLQLSPRTIYNRFGVYDRCYMKKIPQGRGAAVVPIRSTRLSSTAETETGFVEGPVEVETSQQQIPVAMKENALQGAELSPDAIASLAADHPVIVVDEEGDISTTTNGASTTEVETAATYRDILRFLVTTALIWLSEPILSLVDTTVLGRSPTSALVQLAALGPATLLIDSSIFLTYFLAIAVTYQVASAKNKEDGARATSHALGVAAVLGSIISSVVFLGGPALLKRIVGDHSNAVMGEAIYREALSYARIRATVAPLSVMGLVAQAASLASLDTVTPALAVSVAMVTNILGDCLLCIHPFQWGVRGAAVATAAASAFGSLVLLRSTRRRMKRSAVSPNQSKTPSVPLVSLPDRQSLLALASLAGPLFFVIVGKTIGYSSMTIKATTFGVVPLACHNVMLRVFFFFATFGDTFSQAVQTYLPRAMRMDREMEKKDKQTVKATTNVNGSDVKSVATVAATAEAHFVSPSVSSAKPKIKKSQRDIVFSRLCRTAVLVALVNTVASTCLLTFRATSLTTERSVSILMQQYAPWIGASLLLHPFIMIFEGTIITLGDEFRYLVGGYVATLGILALQLHGVCNTFAGVWKNLLLLQTSRLLFFGTRVWRRFARNNHASTLPSEETRDSLSSI